MLLVEQHVISQRDPRFAPIDQAAFAAKNLYNAALYLVRQAFIFEGRYLGYQAVYHQIKGHDAYKALPAKVAQQVLRLLRPELAELFCCLCRLSRRPRQIQRLSKIAQVSAQN